MMALAEPVQRELIIEIPNLVLPVASIAQMVAKAVLIISDVNCAKKVVF
jgi:hypothetical protein